jgi:HD-GYP domain-containing protein (c-di-GMP phosphodiesterase class II)
MQKLPLTEVKAGMKLAKDVILEDGRILLLKGFTIKPRYLSKLKAYDVPFIFVEDEIVELDEISEERVYEDAFTNIKGIMQSIRYDEKVDIVQLKETVNDMVQHILNDDMVFMTLTGIRDIDNYTFLHSVDVCIYAVVTAKALGMEYDVMKRHAISGLEIASQLPGLSEKIARIICQHHEKWDGSGYPLGLNSYDIELGARIISIADVYDALTANRVYRKKRFMPHEAVEYLMANNESQFDPRIMKCFINSIAIYPKDIVVLLNTGEVARVLPSKGMASMRPKVSVITRKDGPPVFDPYEIDLRKNPTIFVVDIIS